MFKKISFILCAVLIFSTVCCKAFERTSNENISSYKEYFKDVIDIKINLEENDYADMLENAEDEKYKSADITFDGIKIENVGFRTKGNLTLRSIVNSDSDRYSFRVKLDKYVDGQTFKGLDEFVLNNMYSDASYLREYLSYEALKNAGFNVPEYCFANIYINNELKGLYLCLEAIDDSYIEKAFSDTTGNLYKADRGSSLKYEENSNYESLELKMGKDTEKIGLKNMINILNSIENGDKKNIEEVLDVDSALKYIAFNYVFSNYDSYQGNGSNNYFLYESNGIFHIIPWDFNMSFNGFPGRNSTSIDSPVSDGKADDYPLVSKLLSVNEYKEKYYSYVKEYVDYCSTLENRIEELSRLIYDYIDADPTKFCTIDEFKNATTYNENEKTPNENMPNTTDMKNAPSDFNNMPAPPEGDKKQPIGENPPMQNGKERPPMPPSDKEHKNMMGERKEKLMNNTNSIVNFIRSRIENINKELESI